MFNVVVTTSKCTVGVLMQPKKLSWGSIAHDDDGDDDDFRKARRRFFQRGS